MKRIHQSRIYLNGVDISKDVYGIELEDIPNKLLTAKVQVYVQSVGTELDENGRVRVVYRLGSDEPEPVAYCPPGVHSMFDPCPGDCTKDDDGGCP